MTCKYFGLCSVGGVFALNVESCVRSDSEASEEREQPSSRRPAVIMGAAAARVAAVEGGGTHGGRVCH